MNVYYQGSEIEVYETLDTVILYWILDILLRITWVSSWNDVKRGIEADELCSINQRNEHNKNFQDPSHRARVLRGRV